MELLPTIGNRIRLFRTAKGLTQENVAEMLQMSVSWYAKVERGEIDLSISHIEQIAKIYSMSAGDLLKIAENHNIFNNTNHNVVNNVNGNYGSITVQERNDKIESLEIAIKEVGLLFESLLTRVEQIEKKK